MSPHFSDLDLTDEQVDKLRRAVYRWWTVSVSREHVKLGPVTVDWFKWPFDGRWRGEACWLCRTVMFRLGGDL